MSDTTAKKSQIDMGTGSIPKLLAKLALPAVLAQIVHLMYNIVDRIFIGHIPEIGASALTGVGLFTPLLMFMTAFAMMAGSGGAPLAAIALGEKNKEKRSIFRYSVGTSVHNRPDENGGQNNSFHSESA